MKKRRELDALVTNGKLPRRKSKSGHELLRSNDSDSSEVEEFSVPIGIKSGKKWNGICPCSSCVALFVFVIMTSCLIACGGLIWMHFELKRDLDNLRERLLTVENRNQGGPEEFQKYHSQIQDLNRTINSIKSGDKGIDKIAKNLTDVSNQIEKLNKATAEVTEGLKDAPYLKLLPKKFDALTESVAKMGSDIQLAQGKVDILDEFKKQAQQHLTDLMQKVEDMQNTTPAPHVPASGREHGNSLPIDGDAIINVREKLQELAVDIDRLNKTISAKLGSLNTSLNLHETRLSLLESFTSEKKDDVKTDEDTANALKELLNGGAVGDESAMEDLLVKVDNVTDMVVNLGLHYQQLQADVKAMNTSMKSVAPASGTDVNMEEMAGFQNQALISLEYLNATVLHLNESVVHLFRVFTQNRNEINNITAHMNGFRNYISNTNNFQKGSTSAPAVTEHAETAPPSPSTSSSTQKGEEVDAGTTSKPAVVIENVSNMEDLKKYFNRWDRNGIGQVDPEDLQDYMSDPPSPAQLKPFDSDNNGKYSLEEMAAALGFRRITKDEVKNIFG